MVVHVTVKELLMKKLFGILVAGLLLFACGAQDELMPAPDETAPYAQAAVEVGRIDMASMRDFEKTVARMDPQRRNDLWQELKVLHDKVHPSDAAPQFTSSAVAAPGGGCSPSRCSHSVGCKAEWCCAFGEDAVYYGPGGCPVDVVE
jgi:hypothetical protein